MASTEPLINPYLWALGSAAQSLAPGSEVGDGSTTTRYQVIAPQVWLDTQPGQLPAIAADQIPRELLPYCYLHHLRLHLPILYSLCHTSQGWVVLLENVPLEGAGQLLPRLDSQQIQAASPLRQLSWLWQMLELWPTLSQWGVAASLLVPDNIRVQGGILRLRALYGGMGQDTPLGAELDSPFDRYQEANLILPTLADLGQVWQAWQPALADALQRPFQEIITSLQNRSPKLEDIMVQLNGLLLQQTARVPVKIAIAGQTDTGTSQPHNEDSCFPLARDLAEPNLPGNQYLIPRVAIICDGIGGHEGGEVASQLALRSMKLQLQAFFQDLEQQSSGYPFPPSVIAEQLAASVRVVNNLITAQNDLQHRSDRQRMASTLVMAVQVQQQLAPQFPHHSHEIYLVHLGDSRAYWMNQRYCHRLTVDDDVVGREVRLGRSFYRAALEREDAQSLTQALGTRPGEALQVHVQRFIVDEDGVLFLCSDGLSDNGVVERYWSGSIAALLGEMQSLEDIVQEWIDLGNQKNGQDNLSLSLIKCRISPDYPILLDPFPEPQPPVAAEPTATGENLSLSAAELEGLTEASAALMAETAEVPLERSSAQGKSQWVLLGVGLGVLLVVALAGAILFLWPNSATLRELLRDRLAPTELPNPDNANPEVP